MNDRYTLCVTFTDEHTLYNGSPEDHKGQSQHTVSHHPPSHPQRRTVVSTMDMLNVSDFDFGIQFNKINCDYCGVTPKAAMMIQAHSWFQYSTSDWNVSYPGKHPRPIWLSREKCPTWNPWVSDLASAWPFDDDLTLVLPRPQARATVSCRGHTPAFFCPKGPLCPAHCSPLIMTYPLSSTSYFHFDLVRVIFRVGWRARERCEHTQNVRREG